MRTNLAVALAFLTGCGASGKVYGTVGGTALKVEDGVGYVDPGEPDLHNIVLIDQGGLCETVKTYDRLKSSTLLDIEIVNMTYMMEGGGWKTKNFPVTPGDYLVGEINAQGKQAFATFNKSDDKCAFVRKYASGGKVTLTSVDDKGAASGTFDLTFDGEDHVTGSFDVPACETVDMMKLRSACSP